MHWSRAEWEDVEMWKLTVNLIPDNLYTFNLSNNELQWEGEPSVFYRHAEEKGTCLCRELSRNPVLLCYAPN